MQIKSSQVSSECFERNYVMSFAGLGLGSVCLAKINPKGLFFFLRKNLAELLTAQQGICFEEAYREWCFHEAYIGIGI